MLMKEFAEKYVAGRKAGKTNKALAVEFNMKPGTLYVKVAKLKKILEAKGITLPEVNAGGGRKTDEAAVAESVKALLGKLETVGTEQTESAPQE